MLRILALALMMYTAPAIAQTGGAEQVITAHTKAYQDKDMARFLSFYAADAVVTMNGFQVQGRQQIREAYSLNFHPSAPPMKVTGRTVDGNYVLDEEAYFIDGEWHCCAYAEYIVENGKIVSATLSMPE